MKYGSIHLGGIAIAALLSLVPIAAQRGGGAGRAAAECADAEGGRRPS
jgi:hypothetical protein